MNCGAYPRVVPVVALGSAGNRFFALTVPSDFREAVYTYLEQQLYFPVSEEHDPLVLSEGQARILVERTLIPVNTVA
jgi:hypothetical protein